MNRWIWMNSIMDRIWFIMMIICSSSSSEGNNPQILVYPQISDCFNYELPESLLPRGGGFCLRHPPPPLPLYSDKWGLYQVIKSPIVLIWCSVPSNSFVITLFFTLYFPWSFGFSLCCLFLAFWRWVEHNGKQWNEIISRNDWELIVIQRRIEWLICLESVPKYRIHCLVCCETYSKQSKCPIKLLCCDWYFGS